MSLYFPHNQFPASVKAPTGSWSTDTAISIFMKPLNEQQTRASISRAVKHQICIGIHCISTVLLKHTV